MVPIDNDRDPEGADQQGKTVSDQAPVCPSQARCRAHQ